MYYSENTEHMYIPDGYFTEQQAILGKSYKKISKFDFINTLNI